MDISAASDVVPTEAALKDIAAEPRQGDFVRGCCEFGKMGDVCDIVQAAADSIAVLRSAAYGNAGARGKTLMAPQRQRETWSDVLWSGVNSTDADRLSLCAQGI